MGAYVHVDPRVAKEKLISTFFQVARPNTTYICSEVNNIFNRRRYSSYITFPHLLTTVTHPRTRLCPWELTTTISQSMAISSVTLHFSKTTYIIRYTHLPLPSSHLSSLLQAALCLSLSQAHVLHGCFPHKFCGFFWQPNISDAPLLILYMLKMASTFTRPSRNFISKQDLWFL